MPALGPKGMLRRDRAEGRMERLRTGRRVEGRMAQAVTCVLLDAGRAHSSCNDVGPSWKQAGEKGSRRTNKDLHGSGIYSILATCLVTRPELLTLSKALTSAWQVLMWIERGLLGLYQTVYRREPPFDIKSNCWDK